MVAPVNLVELKDSCAYRWLALRVKSRCERAIAAAIRQKGFEEFVPLYRCRRRWSDRLKSLELPLFPGYVFCSLDPNLRLAVLTIPGAMHFVGIGRNPATIEDAEIAALQNADRSGLATEPCSYQNAGQLVRLNDGPLTGLEGFLLQVRNEYKVVVSVTLLKRSVAVEIDRRWATPLRERPTPVLSWQSSSVESQARGLNPISGLERRAKL